MQYRVWCKDKKEYEKDEYFLKPCGELLRKCGKSLLSIHPTNHTVERCSDLFDDNGILIFVGDVLEVKLDAKTPYTTSVRFLGGMFLIDSHPSHILLGLCSVRRLSDCCDYGVGDNCDVSCKIVGNIHDKK